MRADTRPPLRPFPPHYRPRRRRGAPLLFPEAVEFIARAVPTQPDADAYTITTLAYGRRTGACYGPYARAFPLERPPADAFRRAVLPMVLEALPAVAKLVELGQVSLLHDLPIWRTGDAYPPPDTTDPLGRIRASLTMATRLEDRHRAAQRGLAFPSVGDLLHGSCEALESFHPEALIRCGVRLPSSPTGYRLWAKLLRTITPEDMRRWQARVARCETDVVFAELVRLVHRLACIEVVGSA
jgi:hypothetical protein